MNAMHRHYFALERERGYVADVSDVIIDSYASCICPLLYSILYSCCSRHARENWVESLWKGWTNLISSKTHLPVADSTKLPIVNSISDPSKRSEMDEAGGLTLGIKHPSNSPAFAGGFSKDDKLKCITGYKSNVFAGTKGSVG